MLANLTSNQYYGGLNNRYDNRVRRLVAMGFKRDFVSNVWIKPNQFGKAKSLHNLIVCHADTRSYYDHLASVTR